MKKLHIVILLFICLITNCLAACNYNTPKKKESISIDSTTIKDSIQKAAATYSYDSSKKYIYLTFDDGPQHGTVDCFDLCKQLHVKASFFMVGLHANKKSDGHIIVGNIKKAYPQILLCNHSFSHAYDKYKNFYHHPETAYADFEENQQLLSIPYRIIRLPGNSAWVTKKEIHASHLVFPVCDLLNAAGYNVIGWDVEWQFNHKTANPVQSPEKMLALVDSAFAKQKTYTPNHLVILSHDRMFRSPQYLDSLSKFIQLLRSNRDYVLETVDHYPNLKPL
jgi:peptidoglycan/xylan/chitin deacetylase (PgdA/CDA1 family)